MSKKTLTRLVSSGLLIAMLASCSFIGCSGNTDDADTVETESEITESAAAEKAPETAAEEEKTPYTKISDRKRSFCFNEGAEGRSAFQVNAQDKYCCRFIATAAFNELDLSCPSYSDNTGSMKMTLFRWNKNFDASVRGEALASETFVDFNDNATLYFEFDEMEAGEYLIMLSEGYDGVGIWKFSESTTGTYIYDNGTELPGVFTMDICYTYTPNKMFVQCASQVDLNIIVTTPEEIVPGEDSPLVLLDAMPDTWVATDALGRTLPTNAETGDRREGKYIGLFFWTWHCGQSGSNPQNVTQIMKEHPELKNDFYNNLWKNYSANAYHWDEPIYGYYNGMDEWVYRRQAEMLANSGVDVVIFDNTNGTYTWKSGYMILCETFEKARAQGVNTPKISFLLPFSDGDNTVTQLKDLYLSIYRDGLYQDLWFYWDGKPLLMSHYKSLNRNDPIEGEIYNFFTFRPGEPTYNCNRVIKKSAKWTWLSVYPQAVTYRADGTPEQMTVGVAQNWSAKAGLTAMNGKDIFGRTYTSKGYDTREDAKLWGANFNEQFEYALDVDPDFIFITGWNEWIAGRNETWGGVKNAFPDEFDETYSRDLEPTKGDLADNYYYQLVSFVRRYKGTRAVPDASAEKKIDIKGDISQWDDVSPRYVAYEGNTFDRDCGGYGNLHYTDTTGRNDITFAKIARDSDNIYFMCQCASDITEYVPDTGWMRLYLDIEGAEGAGWNTFDYIVEPNGNGNASLMKYAGSDNEWKWEKCADVVYTVSGNTIQICVPRNCLTGISGNTFTVNFKWSDNTCITGDIMDFYIHGDVAPGGRFKYQYNAK